MLQANFIPERYERHRQSMRWALYCTRVLPLLGVLLLAVPVALDLLVTRAADRLRQTTLARQSVTATAATTTRIDAALTRLRSTHRLAVGLHAADAQWLALLKELRDRLPEHLWLTRLQVMAETAGEGGVRQQRVLLSGRAGDSKATGQLLEALNRSPWFHSAVLKRARPPEQGAGPSEFEIEAVLRRPIPTAANGGATS